MTVESLEVYLGEVLVGHLSQRSYRVSFAFAESYLRAHRRPVLGQWFEDRLRSGPFAERRGNLPAFFENVLPSDELRLLIKTQHQLDDVTDMDLLAVVGADLPGAMILRDPHDEVPVGFEDFGGVEFESEPASSPSGLHFSLAGLQLKFSLVKQGRILTLPASGRHGRWIAKMHTSRTGRSSIPTDRPRGGLRSTIRSPRWSGPSG